MLRHKPGQEAARVSLRPPQAAAPVQAPPPPSAEPVGSSTPQAEAPDQLLVATQPEQPSRELASEGGLFALQVGSFLDPKNARQLQADLKDRGYNTSVITALDADQREWHLVRMGAYKTLESAAKAAADFSGKERINALVRRANAL